MSHRLDELLPSADVLVLAHGWNVEHAKEASCDHFRLASVLAIL